VPDSRENMSVAVLNVRLPGLLSVALLNTVPLASVFGELSTRESWRLVGCCWGRSGFSSASGRSMKVT
jgi:hypothetical protein